MFLLKFVLIKGSVSMMVKVIRKFSMLIWCICLGEKVEMISIVIIVVLLKIVCCVM